MAILRDRGHKDLLAPIAAAEAERASQKAKADADRGQSFAAQGKAATKRVADIETAIAKQKRECKTESNDMQS